MDKGLMDGFGSAYEWGIMDEGRTTDQRQIL